MPKRVPDWYRCENCLWWFRERNHCHKNPQTTMKLPNDYCASFKDYQTGALMDKEYADGINEGT